MAAGLASTGSEGESLAGQRARAARAVPVGFSEGSGLNRESGAALERHLDGMRDIGARWLRIDIDWSIIEATRGSYDWSVPDRLVDGAQARGMQVLGMIAYTPVWARPTATSDKHPPTNATDYEDFARLVATRYRGRVAAYEIWNEPNRGFWQPRPDPVGYTRLLVGASEAIKAVDPATTVLTGGLSPAYDADDGSSMAPVTFLSAVYAAGGGGHFDGVAHHPYNYPFSPLRSEVDFNANAFAGVTPRLHELMVEHGDGNKLIWATEIGVPTPGRVAGVVMTPRYHARFIEEAFAQWRRWSWAGPMFWYSYRDAGRNPQRLFDNFGLFTRAFESKQPAVDAMRAAISVGRTAP